MADIEAIRNAKIWRKGPIFEDFFVGQIFEHHWGRTILAHDAVLFSTLTLSYNPMYFNSEYAKAHGHPDIVVNPLLVFNTILGMTVQDLSENSGPFLGVFDLKFEGPVYPGATLTARSHTIETRVSGSNPANGIVTWQTEGFDGTGRRIASFRRTNLVIRRTESQS